MDAVPILTIKAGCHLTSSIMLFTLHSNYSPQVTVIKAVNQDKLRIEPCDKAHDPTFQKKNNNNKLHDPRVKEHGWCP